MAETIRGKITLPDGTPNIQGLEGSTAADVTYLIDLNPDGTALSPVIGIVIGITGTIDADFTCGTTNALGSVLTDVVGTAMTSIAASGTYWVSTAGIRYIGIAVDETTGTFAYYILD